jgi:cell division protein FtsZ
MSIKLQVPKPVDLKPRIVVIGVGGAGGNAVNNMISAGLAGVDFIVANTDAQALVTSKAAHRIQLGIHLTDGLGAGSKPEIGEAAAVEAEEDLKSRLSGTHMLFIAAGMGGGTGTGAASVVARIARELGVLTVAVVTKPFVFEGSRRMRIAEAGVTELRQHVDTLIVIPNQNLFRVANERTTFSEAFVMADQVLYSGIACIVDLIVKDGLINLDLADVRTVLTGMGAAVMGTGEASGDRRAVLAAEEAISNQLLDNVRLTGAKALLLSIIGGRDLTLYEVDEAATRVRQEVDPDANIIVGAAFDDTLGDRVRVSIVASGMIETGDAIEPRRPNLRSSVATAVPPTAASDPKPHIPTPPPLVPMVQGRRAAGPPPLPPAHFSNAEPSDTRRGRDSSVSVTDSWHSPDEVRVSDRSGNHLEQNGAPRTAPGRASTESGYQPRGEAFSPQVPADVRRTPRRMPEVDDFPPIGQKEYLAKTGRSADAVQASAAPVLKPKVPPVEPKKGSLLKRLTDAARGRSKPTVGPDPSHTDDDLPVFFGKETRQG